MSEPLNPKGLKQRVSFPRGGGKMLAVLLLLVACAHVTRAQDCNTDAANNGCQNNGECMQEPGGEAYHCACPPLYYGRMCQHLHPCYMRVDSAPPEYNNTCANSATCTINTAAPDSLDAPPIHSCACLPETTGSNCETIIDRNCHEQPDVYTGYGCHNGGSCVAGEDGQWACACDEAHTGKKCEHVLREILRCGNFRENPCYQGGTCVNTMKGFRCRCPLGIRGEYCQLGCPPGHHGPECAHVCDHCLYQECSPYTGVCKFGCIAGFRGTFCTNYAGPVVRVRLTLFGPFNEGLSDENSLEFWKLSYELREWVSAVCRNVIVDCSVVDLTFYDQFNVFSTFEVAFDPYAFYQPRLDEELGVALRQNVALFESLNYFVLARTITTKDVVLNNNAGLLSNDDDDDDDEDDVALALLVTVGLVGLLVIVVLLVTILRIHYERRYNLDGRSPSAIVSKISLIARRAVKSWSAKSIKAQRKEAPTFFETGPDLTDSAASLAFSKNFGIVGGVGKSVRPDVAIKIDEFGSKPPVIEDDLGEEPPIRVTGFASDLPDDYEFEGAGPARGFEVSGPADREEDAVLDDWAEPPTPQEV